METRHTNEEQNLLIKLTKFLNQNIRGVQYGLYSIGFAGLFIALRSVRPFQKFSKPSSIPKSFIERQVPLIGEVKGADLNKGSALLQVAHRPVVPMGRAGRPPFLPVELAAVSPTQLGLSWLQVTLDQQPVTFTVFASTPDTVIAQVKHQGKDISARMVELGFARVNSFDPSMEKNEIYKKLYSKLLRCERSAERHGNGIWHGSSPIYWRIADRLASRLKLAFIQFMPRKISELAVSTKQTEIMYSKFAVDATEHENDT